jgi:hypothetical protein
VAPGMDEDDRFPEAEVRENPFRALAALKTPKSDA